MPYKTFKIKDIGQVVGGGTPSTTNPDYYGENIPWITPKDLSDYKKRYIEHGEKNITKLGLENSSAKLMPAGTVLLSSRAPIGYIAIAANEICTNQGFKSIIPDKNQADSEFLYYTLKNRVEEIKDLGVGTTFAEISGKVLENFEINLPELDDQKKIASILSNLDELIEINQTINDNLLQMAKTVFDELILNSSIKTEMKLTEIANFQNGLAMQNYRPIDGGWLPVLKIKELNQGFCDQSSDRCRSNIDNSVLVENGDVVFSWSGSLIAKIWGGGKAGLNQHLFKVSSVDYPKWFYYFWLQYHMPDFVDIAANKATTMGHICRNHLEEAIVWKPENEVMETVDNTISPIFEMYIATSEESSKLIQLRDHLLPKLMSGEIDVSTLELPTKYSFSILLGHILLMCILYILLIDHCIMKRCINSHMSQ